MSDNNNPQAFLKGESITAGYGATMIISNCSIEVKKGEIVSIVGPNGAGKSTTMKSLLGMIKIKQGSVSFNNKDITKLSTTERINLGLSFVPQNHNTFTGMTVEENLQMGGFICSEKIAENLETIYTLFPVLHQKRNQLAGQLSGGQRQQVAIARAMMTNPEALLLDEPTAGISPIVMEELFEYIIKIKENGLAVLMVEQNARQALEISDRAYVLVAGKNYCDGPGKELLSDENVRQSFLGG